MIPYVIAILRIKNESRWIKKCLEYASRICSGFIILDDGSTDETVSICKSFDKVLDLHTQSNLPFDEVRDKNLLLRLAKKHNPDFILSLDGDEIIQSNSRDIFFEELTAIYPEEQVFEFQSLFVWDKPNQIRIDGIYGNIWYKRLLNMKNVPPELSFQNTVYPGNSHSTRIPSNVSKWNNPVRSKVKVFHYGYFDEQLRKNKFDFYNKLDPNNVEFDGYKHLIGHGKFSGPSGIEVMSLSNELVPTLN